MKFPEQEPVPQGCIPWCPPQSNWNPWIGGNIEEGPYVNQPFDFINQDLLDQERGKSIDEEIQGKRRELPILAEKMNILNLIRQNPVVIIKGKLLKGLYKTIGAL